MTRILGVLSTVFIIGFLAFGLRQALQQKAAAKKDRGPPTAP
jgi:preprotein translocase subunit SecG